MGNPLFKYNSDILQQLSELTHSVLVTKHRVVICIIGKKGSGKSGFGRYLRKKGIDNVSPRKVSVIDDGVMNARFLGIFNKRIKKPFSANKPDELSPFLSYIKSCKILVYVNSNPIDRLSKTDIIVKIEVSEKKRLTRLIKRNGRVNGVKRYNNSHDDFDINLLPHKHFLELRADEF